MTEKLIGVAVAGAKVQEVLAEIDRVEELGIPAAWMTTGATRLDSLTVLAVAASRPGQALYGTSIVPTYPRHPLVMVQQVQALGQLAPGRFRLGVGPSHRPNMVGMGFNFKSPLGHLREYLFILKAIIQTGSVEFDGDHFKAEGSIPEAMDMPVMASALQKGSFELCGEVADGAISWVCPLPYLRDVALPAMEAGAQKAGRATPPLIAHAPVCVNENTEEVRKAVREQIMNTRLPFYQRMFIASGYPEASAGQWSDAMIDGTVFWGNEDQVASKLQGMLDMGATEVLVSPVAAGPDKAATVQRTLELVGHLSK